MNARCFIRLYRYGMNICVYDCRDLLMRHINTKYHRTLWDAYKIFLTAFYLLYCICFILFHLYAPIIFVRNFLVYFRWTERAHAGDLGYPRVEITLERDKQPTPCACLKNSMDRRNGEHIMG